MTRRRAWQIVAAVSTIAVAAVGLSIALGSGDANVDHKPREIPFKAYSAAEDALFARRVAARMWDNAPKEIEVVRSTHTQALRVISPEEEVVDENLGDVAVRVFAIHGKFTHMGSVPRGARAPRGTWLTFAVNEDTGRVLDLSLTDERPKLSLLGRVRRIG